MPKQVILCDHANCNGHLTLIAESQLWTGFQYGDSTDGSYFYQCSDEPRHLFYANAGAEAASVNPDRIYEYRGNMSAEYIRRIMPLHSGHFYPCADDLTQCQTLIEKLPPTVGTIQIETVERRAKAYTGGYQGSITLPESWVGKKVEIKVVE